VKNEVTGIEDLKTLVRPFLVEFLEKVSEYYEIVLYSASTKSYMNSILKLIDPN
jgi:TFIIF-interacting CTD phosphatase-like protein